ncbi:hypothetical protein [Flavobacterium branchiicola]|uniref:SCAN box domain-containing protein n=1 Tax=Flavobacterium branchiicola TaxID=1114875 RepID=A0ABV9PAN0_9FLAO|nr:hypothetical protein [Flavobacterium branchiicola]
MEIKNLEYIQKLSAQYLNKLKPTVGKTYNTEIKVLNYAELGCVITEMLKLCILALDPENDKKSAINVALVLEQVLQLFPSDEFELLDIINEHLVSGTT